MLIEARLLFLFSIRVSLACSHTAEIGDVREIVLGVSGWILGKS